MPPDTVTKHQEVTDPPHTWQSLCRPEKHSKHHQRPRETQQPACCSSKQYHETAEGREEERQGKGESSNREVTCFRLKTRHLRSYSASPTARMLLHPIGCCLPELHSNEPGRWEAASSHESSLLNPSSASPQPGPASTAAAPAHPAQLIPVLIACPQPRSLRETAKGDRTLVKQMSSHTKLSQQEHALSSSTAQIFFDKREGRTAEIRRVWRGRGEMCSCACA